MKGIYPGSFDPPTAGHIDLINRAAALCDELVVAVMVNPSKAGAFTPEDRVEMLKKACSDLKNLKISFYFGMLSDIIKREHCDCIIRGVRNTADFEAEKDRAEANRRLSGAETLVLYADPAYSHISSSMVREILYFDGDITGFVPGEILDEVKRCYNRGM